MKRHGVVLTAPVLIAAALAVTGAAAHRAAPPATTLSMTLNMADGKTPMSDVNVTVFYWPFDPPAHFAPKVMATARTDSTGAFTASLDTSMVPATGLADVGNGPDAFNALITALAPNRQIVVWHQIMQVGAWVNAKASAVTNPDTGGPEIAAEIRQPKGMQPPADAKRISTHYRYIPVLALNIADGMRVNFAYTWDRSTAKQTIAGAAISIATPVVGFGPFSFNGNWVESSDRSAMRHLYAKNAYHWIIWANYKYTEYQWIQCAHLVCTEYHDWTLNHWQGTLAVFNPNKECTKFKRPHHHGRCLRQKVIRKQAYTPPPFTYCGGNCVTVLTTTQPDFTRNTVNTHMYGWQLDVAGFLGLSSQSAYGSITSVTWFRRASGCTGANQRVLWGHNNDPVATPILQAVCRQLP